MTTGLPGQFLRPFAVVITAATLSSLLVSFTLTPLLARLYPARRTTETIGRSPLARFGRAWDRGFDCARARVRALAAQCPCRVAGSSSPSAWRALRPASSLLVFGLIGFDFFPSGDQSELDLTPDHAAGDLARSDDQAVAQKIEAELRQYPEVRSICTRSSARAAGACRAPAQRRQQLRPRSRRCWSLAANARARSADIAEDMRQHFDGRYPGAKMRIGVPNAFGFGGFGGAPIQVQVQGTDPAVVDRLATQIQQRSPAVPGAVGLENSNDNLQTQLRAKIDWTRAADLGVAARDAWHRAARRPGRLHLERQPVPPARAPARFRSAC